MPETQTELDGGIDAEWMDGQVTLSDVMWRMSENEITLSSKALDELAAFVAANRKE
jgi:hypothetical protein